MPEGFSAVIPAILGRHEDPRTGKPSASIPIMPEETSAAVTMMLSRPEDPGPGDPFAMELGMFSMPENPSAVSTMSSRPEEPSVPPDKLLTCRICGCGADTAT
jgi:hypothetical protein